LIAGSPRHMRQITDVPRARATTESHGNAAIDGALVGAASGRGPHAASIASVPVHTTRATRSTTLATRQRCVASPDQGACSCTCRLTFRVIRRCTCVCTGACACAASVDDGSAVVRCAELKNVLRSRAAPVAVHQRCCS
jgi:hypothetical protein